MSSPSSLPASSPTKDGLIRVQSNRSKILFEDDDEPLVKATDQQPSRNASHLRETLAADGPLPSSSESTSSLLSSSELSSDSSSVEISSDVSEETRPRAKAKARRTRKKVASSSSSCSGPRQVVKELKKKGRKEAMIAELLCRWWYVLPEWPPSDYDYTPEMARRRLKVVPFEAWEEELDVDAEGKQKVYPVGFFPGERLGELSTGVFRNSSGEAIDLRPLEGKPCYSNFKHRDVREIRDLLVTALENQIDCLKQSEFAHTDSSMLKRQEAELMRKLTHYRGLKL